MGCVLTRREREILSLKRDGCNGKQVAQILCISHQTVKNHMTSIFLKLGVRSTLQAVLVDYIMADCGNTITPAAAAAKLGVLQ